jgi:hypothetical protein
MPLEIVTAQQLFDKGEIDALEVNDPKLFANRRVVKFSDLREGMQFAYDFVHQYLVPKYGRDQASKFPMAKTGPSRDAGAMLTEMLGLAKSQSPQPVWFAVPEERFVEVEEFLKQYKPN